jgi:predicted O-linked N-acetylglucosamine transferase (SPINDLY family)
MLLGAMPTDGENEILVNLFAKEGITSERLVFHSRTSVENYLSLHHQVDICLDTFPYNGGTTTFHALSMGVPTLTLAGSTPPGRQGSGALAHTGLEAFVAVDKADFVGKGLSWAANLVELSILRMELRKRFKQSAMGQPAIVASGLERALRVMWRRWCMDLPAESFEVRRQDSNDTIHKE